MASNDLSSFINDNADALAEISAGHPLVAEGISHAEPMAVGGAAPAEGSPAPTAEDLRSGSAPLADAAKAAAQGLADLLEAEDDATRSRAVAAVFAAEALVAGR
jgi:hypothetical protein